MGLAFIKGFLLALGLILAIGAQNAFVLRQGLKREYIHTVVFISILSDIILIFIGVFGLDKISDDFPHLTLYMLSLGSVFLLIYGLLSFYRAYHLQQGLVVENDKPKSYGLVIMMALGVTWLNPHVYLDTMFLIGSYALNFKEHRLAFALGASSASFLFFITLGYGAGMLRGFLSNKRSWVIIEISIGLLMLFFAALMVMGIYKE